MSEYTDVDAMIENWVDKVGSTLIKGWGGKPARFFYLPGNVPRECFVVSIFPPAKGRLDVQAASVDTNDGAEMLEVWEGPAKDLDVLLRKAMAKIKTWKDRPQQARA